MSILFKGNVEEGNYTLIKTTDGWVLKGKTSYAGFNFSDRPQGEWIIEIDANGNTYGRCSICGMRQYAGQLNFCPDCGARMKGANNETTIS